MATAVPKTTAEAAVKYLRQLAEVELGKFEDVPMLVLPSDNHDTKAVVDSWFGVCQVVKILSIRPLKTYRTLSTYLEWKEKSKTPPSKP